MNIAFNNKIFETAFDGNWRIEHVFHLGAMLGDYTLPSNLEETLDGWQSEESFPVLGLPTDAIDWERDDVIEWLRTNRKFGFFVQVATPVREYSSSISYAFSWANYRTQWLYDEDFTAIVIKAQEWVREIEQEFRSAAGFPAPEQHGVSEHSHDTEKAPDTSGAAA